MRILLVEDNRDILANLADYLGMKATPLTALRMACPACTWLPPNTTT